MRRVKISDIVRETGLSRSTVDRVLNGREKVHARTRAVVEKAVRRLSAPPSDSRADLPGTGSSPCATRFATAPAFSTLATWGG